jgi:hypothetical protein
MTYVDNWEGDKRPKRHSWAPGDYMCHCIGKDCKIKGDEHGNRIFIGDKRAHHCADCAYAMPDPVPYVPPGAVPLPELLTLIEIEKLCNVDRTTVIKANAFEEFKKINAVLVEVRTLARAAIAKRAS